jgi:hypothetical protein
MPFPMTKKAAPDLGEMDPLDKPKGAPRPAAPPEMAAPKQAPDADDYGAKLTADIEAVGAEHGMDAATSREAAGAFFRAAAECLMGGGEQEPAQEAEMPEGPWYGR